MKNKFLFILPAILFMLLACRQNQQEKMNSPGPITEHDKSRYNLNSGDEVMYDAIDSTTVDSLRKDSVEERE